ncbi:MAG: hypothetical protein PUA95_05655 [Lactimicrobium massiliense]|nr:hypothetical protein [Lactimicrobium massiliense]MDD6230200.1 hypothetical protein [Lactimicrobium massiliense]MDD6561293.1 hypothetical protein [Lactimicrobium massiliense]
MDFREAVFIKKILRQAVAMFAFAFTGVTEAEEINDASVEKIEYSAKFEPSNPV